MTFGGSKPGATRVTQTILANKAMLTSAEFRVLVTWVRLMTDTARGGTLLEKCRALLLAVVVVATKSTHEPLVRVTWANSERAAGM